MVSYIFERRQSVDISLSAASPAIGISEAAKYLVHVVPPRYEGYELLETGPERPH